MLRFKYYDKIDARIRTRGARRPKVPDFEIDEFASSGFWARASSWLFRTALLTGFAILRAVWPNPQFGRLVIVTRERDVRQVLLESDYFEVPFGREMNQMAADPGSVLGLDGEIQLREHRILEKVVLPEDAARIRAKTKAVAARQIKTCGGQLDVMKDFITRVATEACIEYLGLKVDEPDLFAGYTMSISMLLFADPFANERTYQLARRAAFNIRSMVDNSIVQAHIHAHANAAADSDSVAVRLVRLQASDPLITDGMIRANLMGLATGLVPTITLAAGKIFEELLRRPSARAAAAERARLGDMAGLRGFLLEAARLNPPLFPGQWRYARKSGIIAPGTFRSKRVTARSILLVATASALRDRQRFPSPGCFSPHRTHAPDLIFGFGPHRCLGEHLALAQMEELFAALLPLKGLRRLDGPTGYLSSVGPFPRRLDVEFESGRSPARQTMLLFCAPVAQNDVTELRKRVVALGNPAKDEISQALDGTNIVHFASMSVINAGNEETPAPFLVFELNVDGSGASAIRTVAEKAGNWLGPIFKCTVGGSSASLVELLQRYALDLQTLPWGATGYHFNGTPEFPVSDIDQQDRLAAYCRDVLQIYEKEHFGLGDRASAALNYVRDYIDEHRKWYRVLHDYGNPPGNPDDDQRQIKELLDRGAKFADFLTRPSRRRPKISEWSERTNWDAAVSFVSSRSAAPLAIALATFFLGSSRLIYLMIESPAVGRVALAIEYGLVATVVMIGGLIAGFLGLLRWYEVRDVPEDRQAALTVTRHALRTENHPGYVQNHFTAVTPLKPGWFRKLTLALALWSIKQLALHRFRPGFVLNMGTIHYAKWFRIPRTGTLLFLSNYDGSWESYLEDFVTKAHPGQSAAWSNGQGFPRTRFLIFDGARDGDRFKRWVRRQQVPSHFWYSRFPHLTTDQIRNNALIHDGLMRARTETAAQAWLDCFGSIPRPDYQIETDEVQSLVLRGLRKFERAACAIIRLPSNATDRRKWLTKLMPAPGDSPRSRVRSRSSGPMMVTFGNGHDDQSATFVGFSAAGLAKLGIPQSDDDDGMGTFPAAFRIGMAQRSRIVGDFGASAPDKWRWADSNYDTKDGADAVLLVYASTAKECDRLLDEHAAVLGGRDVAFLHVVATSPAGDDGLLSNHFGFRDGISQPVIKGTERLTDPNKARRLSDTNKPRRLSDPDKPRTPPRDIVEPGEFILGYRNNQGYFPPTPTVSPDSDGQNLLPQVPAGSYSRFPEFASAAPNTPDFGRNGTFLVIRQLQQHVEKFDELTKTQAQRFKKSTGASKVRGEPITKDWIAAKMMGRKSDGTPLIPGVKAEDNDFSYGLDDPQGLSCPFGAHIRRANPRDSLHPLDPAQQEISNRHRLMRRGRSYQIGKEKGLLFMCLCADLERQFEFVQQSWIGSPVFHGLNDEPDPIAASKSDAARASDPAHRKFTIPTIAGPVVLEGMESVVTTLGGGYFFLPSRSALLYLANLED